MISDAWPTTKLNMASTFSTMHISLAECSKPNASQPMEWNQLPIGRLFPLIQSEKCNPQLPGAAIFRY